MRRVWQWVLIGMLAAIAAACAHYHPLLTITPTSATFEVEADTILKTVDIAGIELSGNPTTGYRAAMTGYKGSAQPAVDSMANLGATAVQLAPYALQFYQLYKGTVSTGTLTR